MYHSSSQELLEFLTEANAEVLFDLIKILSDRLGFNELNEKYQNSHQIPSIKSERRKLASLIVHELEYFGSNNAAYYARWIFSNNKGVGYHEILYDVCKALNKHLNKKINIPRVAKVSEREEMVCAQILGIALQDKTDEEISKMLAEAGLENDALRVKAVQSAIQDGAGALIVGLVKVLGKKTVTTFVFSSLQWIIAKKLGKEAAEKLILAVSKKVAQKTVASFFSGIGVILIAIDVIGITSPATRVTIPAVALISSVRCAARIDND